MLIVQKLQELESLKQQLQLENERLNQLNQEKFLKSAFIQSLTESQPKDDSFLQLSYSYISHDKDTEDIADEVNPTNYDFRHSKAWNAEVDKQALELENELKIEENMERSKQKAKEEQRKKLAAYEAQKKKDALEEELYQLEKKQNKLKQKKAKQTDFSISQLPLYDFDSDEAPIESAVDISESVDKQQIINSQWDEMLEKMPTTIV